MIKIQNNTATREPIPAFLQGLAQESLADLSWTDPQLGVQDCAWWPEEHQATDYDPATHKLGTEQRTVDAERKVVVVTHEVVPLTIEEVAQREQVEKDARNAGIKQQIAALDLKRIRPLAEGDTAYLADLNAQIQELRSKLL